MFVEELSQALLGSWRPDEYQTWRFGASCSGVFTRRLNQYSHLSWCPPCDIYTKAPGCVSHRSGLGWAPTAQPSHQTDPTSEGNVFQTLKWNIQFLFLGSGDHNLHGKHTQFELSEWAQNHWPLSFALKLFTPFLTCYRGIYGPIGLYWVLPLLGTGFFFK